MSEPIWRSDRRAWMISFVDPTRPKGKQRRKGVGSKTPGKRGKQEAVIALAQKDAEFAAVRLGVESPADHIRRKTAARHIDEILEEFKAHLQGKGTTTVRIGRVMQEARIACSQCKFMSLIDIDPVRFERFLKTIIDRGRSYNTRNSYRAIMIQLCTWAVQRNLIERNPLAMVPKLNEAKDSRRPRRALSVAEFDWLLDHTRSKGAIGTERALYYWILGHTGLRWTEIKRLRRDHLDLEAGAIRLDGSMTKNGKVAQIGLSEQLLANLKDRFGMQLGSRPLFRTQPQRLTWMRDLKSARQAHIDAAPNPKERKARAEGDFLKYETVHGFAYRASLRATFCTHLYHAGVDLRMAQEMMRHSDVSLTANVYTKLDELSGKRAAAEQLSRLGSPQAAEGRSA